MDRARSRDMIIFWTSCFARYPGSALTTERRQRWPAEAPLSRQERPFRRPYQTALITTRPAWSRLFPSQQNHSSPRRKTNQRENAFSVPVPSPGHRVPRRERIRAPDFGRPRGPGRATRLAGHADPCTPWRYQAGSAVPSLLHSRRRVRRSGQPGLSPDGRCAGRAVAGRPLRCRRGPSSRRLPWSVPAVRRAGSGHRGGRGRRSGPRSPGPDSRRPVRAGRPARGDPGPAGLRRRSVRRPGRKTGAADARRAARPRPRLRGLNVET
jgi:hypothetical protein